MRPFGPEPTIDTYSIPPAVRPWESVRPLRRARRVPLVHIVLFVVTFITTAMAGAFQVGADPLSDPASIQAGFPFAVTLLSILLIHELGHYTLSKVHGVRATLPYFIPAPPVFIGTFGAFIRMKSPPSTRRALFDVGAAGPWAGLLVAIPAVIIGLHMSEVRPAGLDQGGSLVLGDSLLFKLLTRLTLGATADDATIVLHPVALAGWLGLFVTFLNLLPVGQLDGGHVTYAMFGRWHRWISRLFLGVIAFLGFQGWDGWFVWVVLLMFIGLDHPPTRDIVTPLDGRRRLAAWLTVGAFIVTFMPEPISIAEPSPAFEGERTPVVWQAQPQPADRPVSVRTEEVLKAFTQPFTVRSRPLLGGVAKGRRGEYQQPRPARGIPL
jgi:membrane-associated protease RseP (regulator of RpoE activity)